MAPCFGFHNKSLSEAAPSRLSVVMVELGSVVGQEERARKEIVVERELLLHACESEGQCVFAADDAHRREVVDALSGTHPLQSVVDHAGIAPL